MEAAQDRWRAVNGPHLVALVRAGAFAAALIQAHRLDDGPLASRAGPLRAALPDLDAASAAP